MQCLQTRIRTSVRCSAPARCVRYGVRDAMVPERLPFAFSHRPAYRIHYSLVSMLDLICCPLLSFECAGGRMVQACFIQSVSPLRQN